MDITLSQLTMALPEILLLCLGCFVLVLDVYLPERYRYFTYIAVQAGLVVVFIMTLPQFGEYRQAQLAFSGNYVVDKLAVLTKLFIYIFGFIAFAYAREYINPKKIPSSEYYLLGIFSILGMSIMASGYSFLSIYLGLELLSLSLYAMVAMNKTSVPSVEAAMKYIVLGGVASALLLYGISMLYGISGSIQLNVVGQAIVQRHDVIPLLALSFVIAGLIFKFGGVPFHMWVPDVYQGAATPATLFIASAPKIAAFAITVRILVQAVPSLHMQWEQVLIAIAVLSMFTGNLLAIAQTNFKRMLAYSSIAHIGYTLLGILAGPNSTQGYSAAMFYIATYVLVAAGAFAIIGIMSQKGVEMDRLDDYRGLNARNPWLAFMMLLLMFSMAGVPPTVGFFAKFGLLEALVQADYVWLAVLALIFAVIGAYYYLRVVLLMYFEDPAPDMAGTSVVLSHDMKLVISINGMAALLLGLFPSFFIDLCRITVG